MTDIESAILKHATNETLAHLWDTGVRWVKMNANQVFLLCAPQINDVTGEPEFHLEPIDGVCGLILHASNRMFRGVDEVGVINALIGTDTNGYTINVKTLMPLRDIVISVHVSDKTSDSWSSHDLYTYGSGEKELVFRASINHPNPCVITAIAEAMAKIHPMLERIITYI